MATQINSFADLERILDRMAHNVESGSYANAFELISDDLEEQSIDQFRRGIASDGTAWKPLAAATVARKGHGQILVEYGDLMWSLTGQHKDAIREIHDREMTFGTSDPKAAYHQSGTKNMPARPPVGISDDTLDRAAEHVADRALELALEALK